MYIGLYRAAKRYRVKPRTLKRILRYVEHRVRQAGERTWIEVDTRSLEKYLKFQKMGVFRKIETPEEYITTKEAEELSGVSSKYIAMAALRGRVKAVRNPVGEWLVEIESLRQWARFRPKKKRPNYEWLLPREVINRIKQFWNAIELVREHARKHNINLEPGWVDRVMSEIRKHRREKISE